MSFDRDLTAVFATQPLRPTMVPPAHAAKVICRDRRRLSGRVRAGTAEVAGAKALDPDVALSSHAYLLAQ